MKYKCRLCGKEFSTEGEARKHLRNDHFIDPYNALIEKMGD